MRARAGRAWWRPRQGKEPGWSPARLDTRATRLAELGIRFSLLGRPAEAVTATEEAVAIRRELAAANPARYRPDLASSLSNLGNWLSELAWHLASRR